MIVTFLVNTALFQGNSEPHTRWFEHEHNPVSVHFREGETEEKDALLPKCQLDWRGHKKRSFAWFAPLCFIWPPPLVMTPEHTSNLLWSFEVANYKQERHILAILTERLKEHYIGGFFAKVHLMALLPSPNLTEILGIRSMARVPSGEASGTSA